MNYFSNSLPDLLPTRLQEGHGFSYFKEEKGKEKKSINLTAQFCAVLC